MSALPASADPAAALQVAVVIPAFAAERFIAEALESVLAQTRPATEVIVVDDGSRDGTAEVVARYFDRGVRLIAQGNQGCGAARNRGVASSSAALIAFLDADDLWPADRLARLVAALATEPHLAAVNGRAECFASPDMSAADRARLVVPQGPQAGWLPGTFVLRRDAWERVGPFDESLQHGGEFIDWVARARAQQVAIRDCEVLALRRRVHAESMTVRAGEALGQAYLAVVRGALARAQSGAIASSSRTDVPGDA